MVVSGGELVSGKVWCHRLPYLDTNFTLSQNLAQHNDRDTHQRQSRHPQGEYRSFIAYNRSSKGPLSGWTMFVGGITALERPEMAGWMPC